MALVTHNASSKTTAQEGTEQQPHSKAGSNPHWECCRTADDSARRSVELAQAVHGLLGLSHGPGRLLASTVGRRKRRQADRHVFARACAWGGPARSERILRALRAACACRSHTPGQTH